MKVKSYNKALSDVSKKLREFKDDEHICVLDILNLINTLYRPEKSSALGVPNPPTDPKGGGTR